MCFPDSPVRLRVSEWHAGSQDQRIKFTPVGITQVNERDTVFTRRFTGHLGIIPCRNSSATRHQRAGRCNSAETQTEQCNGLVPEGMDRNHVKETSAV